MVAVHDFDDIRIGTTLADVEPTCDPPGVDIDAARTIFLFRSGDADSRSAADEAVNRAGIRREHLVELPCATVSPADYTALAAQIETPLASWLANCPQAAQRCRAICAGYHVPPMWGAAGNTVCSRLAMIDSPEGAIANPLLALTPGPITPAASIAAGVRLAWSMGAASLADYSAMLDLGLAARLMPTVGDADAIASDSATLASTLAAGMSRLAVVEPGDATSAALQLLDDATNVAAIDAGSRIMAANSGGPGMMIVSVPALWAGWTSLGLHLRSDAADSLDFERLLAALRAGSTLAEAFWLAAARMGSSQFLYGWALATAALPRCGYNMYIGADDESNIDYTTIVAARGPARSGLPTLSIPLASLDADRQYFLAIRPVSNLGVEGPALIRPVIVSGGAALGGSPPVPQAAIISVSAAAGGYMRVTASYDSSAATVRAASLQISTVANDFSAPVATLGARVGRVNASALTSVAFGHGQMVQLYARAVAADGSASAAVALAPARALASIPAAVGGVVLEAAQ